MSTEEQQQADIPTVQASTQPREPRGENRRYKRNNQIIEDGISNDNQTYKQIQIPSSAKLQKLKKEINWPHSYTNKILQIDLKKKVNVMHSKIASHLSISEYYKNGQFSSSFLGKLGLTTSLWNFEADFANVNKNSLRAQYTQKDIVQSQYFRIKKFSFNFSLKNLNQIKMKPSIEFSQNNIDFKLEGSIQQSDSKQKNALHEFSAEVTHVCNPVGQLYLETVLGKQPKKKPDIQFNSYYINNNHILNSNLALALSKKNVNFKDLQLRYQMKDVFEVCSGYNWIENSIWYSSIQRFQNFDLGMYVQKRSKFHKIKKEHNSENNDESPLMRTTSGTSINLMCKFRNLSFAPKMTTQFHLENFHQLSFHCRYKLSNKNLIEAAVKIPLLSEYHSNKSGEQSRGDHGSNVLPFFLTLKLSE